MLKKMLEKIEELRPLIDKLLGLLSFLVKKKKPILITGVLLFLLVFGSSKAVYLRRKPVLIVSDSTFSRLYGQNRLDSMESRMQKSLFRRIITVIVDENAGPDLVAIAIEGVHKSPLVVFFPSRYIEGARHYLRNNPGVPVCVMTTSTQKTSEDEGLIFICTDTALDFYRAGLCAALLAGGSRVLFISEGNPPDAYREAFLQGLGNQGQLDEVVWAGFYSDNSSEENLGCAVMTGPAVTFLEQNLDIPVILFSWADPAMTPRTVKLVFDDSSWALLPRVIKSLPLEAGQYFFASEPLIIKERIGGGRNFRRLKAFVKQIFPNK